MKLASKKKSIFKIILIVLLSLIICAGAGVGIYFLVRDKDKDQKPDVGITQQQKDFGSSVSGSENKLTVEELVLPSLDGKVELKDVSNVSENFVVSKNSSNQLSIHNVQSGESVSLENEIASVVSIHNNLAVAIYNDEEVLLNLVDGKIICSLSNVVYKFVGDHAVLFAYKGTTLSVSIGGNKLDSSACYVINTKTVQSVLASISVANLIDYHIYNNYLVIFTNAKSTAYALTGEFKKVLELDNKESADGEVNHFGFAANFSLDEFYRIYELSSKALFVHKTIRVEESQAEQVLSDKGFDEFVANEYFVYLTNTSAKVNLTDEGRVLSPQSLDFGDEYIAITSSALENKKEISKIDRTITYYLIEGDEVQSLYQIVSYDHVKYGNIVGFKDDKLVVGGGSNSAVLGFDGLESSGFVENAQQISKITDDMVVYTSVSGLKGLVSSSGEILHLASYIEMSPIISSRTIAYDGDYLLLLKDKTFIMIDNFAEEFKQYVFSGIGYYFVDNQNGTYDVLDFNQNVVYDNASLTLSYEQASNVVLMSVNNEKLIKITPVDNTSLLVWLEEQEAGEGLNGFVGFEQESKSDDDINVEEVKNAVNTGGLYTSILSGTVSVYDSATGMASLNLSKTIIFSNLSFSSSIVGLEDWQLDLMPDVGILSTGAHFMTYGDGSSYNVVIAIFKTNSEYYVVFGFKGVYLQSVNLGGTTYLNGAAQSRIAFDIPCAPRYLDGGVSSTGGKVSWGSTLFDGGFVLKTTSASLSVSNFIIKNALYLDSGKNITQGLAYDTASVSYNDFSIRRSSAYIYITATSGLVVEDAKVNVGTSEFTNLSTAQTIGIRITDVTKYEGSTFTISFRLRQAYCTLKIDDSTKYYGFSDYAGGGFPSLGFKNFNRISTISIPTKTGYTFKGCNLNETDEATLEINSSGYLTSRPYSTLTNNSVVYKYVSLFDPNTYTMTLDYNNDSGYKLEAIVTYGESIGTLGTPTKKGYRFLGWYYGGTKYESNDICDIASDFTLVAQWALIEINITFNLNKSIYSGGNAVGNIKCYLDKVYFASDYLTYKAGSECSTIPTKKVDYGTTIGDLPELVGYNSGKTQEYVFEGWYTSPTAGSKVTETLKATYDGDITLYARYSRKLTTIDVTTSKTGDSYTDSGSSVMTSFYNLKYEGSDAAGTVYKTTFSTSETGSTKWSASSGVYSAYGFEGDSITFVITQRRGYYIDSITYRKNNGLTETVISGVWNSAEPNAYSLSYAPTTLFETNVELGSTYDTIHLTINSLDVGLYNDVSGTYQHGALEISYKAKEFTTTVTFDKSMVGRNSTFMTSGETVTSTYNQNTEYTLLPQLTKDGQRTWLKTITVDGVEYTFSSMYGRESNQTVYLTGLIELQAKYNSTTGLYNSFTLIVQNQTNYVIDIQFEYLTNVNITSTLGHPDLAGEGTDGFTLDTNNVSDIGFTYVEYYSDEKYITYRTIYLQDNILTIYGSKLIVTYKNVTGYSFYDISLKDSSGTALSATNQENISGGVKFTFEISDLSKDYSMVIRSKAIKYTVKYEDNNMASDPNPATGSTPSSTHYYNVWSNLSTNGYSKTGYSFLGYSKTKKQGNMLTTSDRDFTDAQLLQENLTSTDGDTVTLYTVFGVKPYTINYNLNDSIQGNGTSSATLSTGTGTVVFDNRFSTLKTATRIGYTFDGWFTAATGGDQVFGGDGDGDLFDIKLYNKLEVDETTPSIKLYAHWTAKTYTVIIQVNDSTQSNGSSPAVGETTGHTVEFDKEGDFVLPEISRAGYNFMGYKSVKLTSDQSKTDTHGYIGYGEGAKTTFDYFIISKDAYKPTVNEGANTIVVYAVWQAKTMKAYVNLNYEYLNLPKNSSGEIETDGRFTIGSDFGTGYATSYTEVIVEFEFDKSKNLTMPVIYPRGYNFVAYYLTKEFNPAGFSKFDVINGTTAINYEMFQKATFINASGESKNLEIGDDTLSIYATYTYKSYEVSYTYQNNAANNPYVYMLGLDNYVTYDHTSINSSNHISGGKISGVYYGKDVVCDIMSQKGQYVQEVVIKYKHNIKGTPATAKTLSFGWNSGTFTLSLDGQELLNEYKKIDGYFAYAYQGLYIKVLDYNKNGVDGTNSVQDAVRVIIGVDFIKTDLYIEMGTAVQTFNMVYHRKTSATSSYSGKTYEKVVEYGYKIQESDLKYAYTPGFMFQNYYYGNVANVSSELVEVNDEIYSDTNIVATYTLSTKHSVVFYYWDGEKYVRNDEVSSEYVLGSGSGASWTKGTNTDYYSLDTKLDGNGKPTGGFLTMMPTPSNDQWALSHFAGYVISSSTPSTYFDITGNAKNLPRFDSTTLVEQEIHVYPAFVNPYIKVTYSGSMVGAEYEFYDVQPNGDAKKIEQSDIMFLWFTASEYDAIITNKYSYENNVEKTIGAVLSYNYEDRIFEYMQGSEFVPVPPTGSSIYCVCAVIFRYNEAGERYIYLASENCLYWNGSFSNMGF